MIEPFIAGIWCGESKPPCREYLEPYISELKELLSNGLDVNLQHIIVKFGIGIMDSPARSMVKGEKHYSAFIQFNIYIHAFFLKIYSTC